VTETLPRDAKLITAAFFDGIGTAHSLPLVEGLDRAAEASGLRRLWTTALAPCTVPDAKCVWTPGRAFYAEFCETGSFPAMTYRRTLSTALAAAADDGASFFCDLAVEHLLASHGSPLRPKLPTVWVVHQSPHPKRNGPLFRRAKFLAANRQKWRHDTRVAHARGVLRSLARAGGQFVVHTERAQQRLAQTVPANRIYLGSWPIVSRSHPRPLAAPNHDRTVAIFPGEARPGKGLDLLIEALPSITGVELFDFPTVVSPDARRLLGRAADPRVRLGTSWLPNDGYLAHLRDATVAVLPYRSSAMTNAGISASLLDVLSVGLPAVVSKPIADALPENYGGAVVVDADSSDALAKGIARALREIDDLGAAARAQGPTFVAQNHSYESYLEVLIDAGASH
jgi:glycosyltransferase involved in cell wall biosynthesis